MDLREKVWVKTSFGSKAIKWPPGGPNPYPIYPFGRLHKRQERNAKHYLWAAIIVWAGTLAFMAWVVLK